MNRRSKLPKAPEAKERPQLHSDVTPKAREMWDGAIKAADVSEDDNVINILDAIGYDWWTDSGTTAKRINAALKYIGRDNDVIVNINSPGGDVFEGLAIYNLLREHKGKVTVRILGIAASAASFIAMAADELQIARAGFLMIHNSWTVAAGDRNDLRDVADFLEQIDGTIADVYHVRSGIDAGELATQMDTETWISGKTAVETGMADGFLDSDIITKDEDAKNTYNAVRKIDKLMAMQGIPRSERRELIAEIKQGTQNAAQPGMHDATEIPQDLINDLRAVAAKFEQLNA